MIRFQDEALEAAVQDTSDAVDAAVWAAADAAREVRLTGKTRLKASCARAEHTVGAWLGSHAAPPRSASARLTMVRGVDGVGLALAPSLKPKDLADPGVQVGADAAKLLAVLEAFERPATVDAVVQRLKGRGTRDLIAELAVQRFLARAD
jgi:hypothetical protein